MNLNEALERLYSLQKFGIKLGLDNIKKLLEYLGNPQEKFDSFHIAGTNGKGSTSSFMASILMEAGYKVGLYTSPHFVRFNERIRINGKEIPDEFVAEFVSALDKYIEENKPTFFEVTTALAFKYFADSGVDFAVVETGLGGRLDATNTVIPLASVITSISLEHVEILGDTLEKIAAEKGGIIKENRSVFIGNLPPEAEITLENISKETNSAFFRLSDYTYWENNKLCFSTSDLFIQDVSPALKGLYQKSNASLAILCLLKTLELKDADIIQKGLRNVVANSGIQGRCEIYNERPCVIFDSAHNLEGVTNFLTCFSQEYQQKYIKRTLLFGVMKDKAIGDMLQVLAGQFDEIRVTSIEYERAATLAELNRISAELNIKVITEENGAVFIRDFVKTRNNECLVVLGSMYVLGKIKEELLTKKKLDIFS
ncbi:MAG: bifunctional folylpolyglutamate synthase/dihydrofolate synthase [Ignavibacteriales bacterium]